MKTFESIDEFQPPEGGIVIMIGKADSLHLGHIALINETIRLGQELSLETGILSLIPDPQNPIFNNDLKFVLTLDERRDFLNNWPLDNLIYQKMGSDFTSISAEDFLFRILHRRMHVSGVVVGWDFLFGQARQGNVNMMRGVAAEIGFELRVVDPVMIDNMPVKTSTVRELIEKAEFARAQSLLGYPFFITGKVIKGNAHGTKLGFPTANLEIPATKLLPKQGVHVVRALFDDEQKWGLASIGTRPTLYPDSGTVTEVWLRDFDGNLLDKKLKIEFFQYIRDEIKFTSPDELTEKMREDANYLEHYLREIRQI